MALDFVSLKLDGRMLQTVYQALDELPGRIGRPVFEELTRQVQQQLNEHAESEKAAEVKRIAELRDQHRTELKAELHAQRVERQAAAVAEVPPQQPKKAAG